MDETDFLTTGEVAARLKANAETVRRLIRTGRLAAIKLGNNYRIPAEEYRRFATPEPTPKAPRTQRDRVRKLLRSI